MSNNINDVSLEELCSQDKKHQITFANGNEYVTVDGVLYQKVKNITSYWQQPYTGVFPTTNIIQPNVIGDPDSQQVINNQRIVQGIK